MKREIFLSQNATSSSESDSETDRTYAQKKKNKRRRILDSSTSGEEFDDMPSPTSSPIDLPSDSADTIAFSSPIAEPVDDDTTIIISTDEELESRMLAFDDSTLC